MELFSFHYHYMSFLIRRLAVICLHMILSSALCLEFPSNRILPFLDVISPNSSLSTFASSSLPPCPQSPTGANYQQNLSVQQILFFVLLNRSPTAINSNPLFYSFIWYRHVARILSREAKPRVWGPSRRRLGV